MQEPTTTPDLLLYKAEWCTYCNRVRAFMDVAGISIPMKDIDKEPAAFDELEAAGAEGQVPCLFIDGKPLLESNDIIAYLAKLYDKPDIARMFLAVFAEEDGCEGGACRIERPAES